MKWVSAVHAALTRISRMAALTLFSVVAQTNLNLYQGQIFVLLGHNVSNSLVSVFLTLSRFAQGAGKTTTISML